MIESTVSRRIEGTQSATRDSDKMWLVRLLELTRKYVLDDLIVVKNLMSQCFPPHYNSFHRYEPASSVQLKSWLVRVFVDIISLCCSCCYAKLCLCVGNVIYNISIIEINVIKGLS